mgnify:CR=1 FL=1
MGGGGNDQIMGGKWGVHVRGVKCLFRFDSCIESTDAIRFDWIRVGLHFGPKKTGKISIAFEELVRNSV